MPRYSYRLVVRGSPLGDKDIAFTSAEAIAQEARGFARETFGRSRTGDEEARDTYRAVKAGLRDKGRHIERWWDGTELCCERYRED